jgi:hypothetical protein
MNFFTKNNIERADGFARLVRILFVIIITVALGKCACGQVAFTAPFSVRISGDTTDVRHALASVSIDSTLTIKIQGSRRTYCIPVNGAEAREYGVIYILADGVAHHAIDKNGQMVIWTGSAGKWIFYEYLPLAVSINTKRE